MESSGKRRRWARPALIALARQRSEESVLDTCKYASPTGPGAVANACSVVCVSACSDTVPS